jgi:iron complex outermembrane receptor protein
VLDKITNKACDPYINHKAFEPNEPGGEQKMTRALQTLLLTSASFAAFAVTTPVLAQQADSAAASPGQTAAPTAQLAEVVVTAEKQPSEAQSTPISLDVFQAKTLQENGVGNIAELSALDPTINIGQSAGASIITIRGVSSRDTTEIGDSDVAVNIDGIYLQRPTGMNASFYDLSRVEVLRGPQGTLYGRNAVGGVINIITQAPILGSSSGYVSMEEGNYDTTNLDGAVNVPLGDTLVMRASFVSRYNEGYRDNGMAGRGDDEDDRGGRLQFLYKPNDQLHALFGVSYLHQGGTGSVYDGVPLTFDADGSVATRAPTSAYSATHFPLNTAGHLNVDDLLAHAQIDYDFGSAILTYIGGYHRQDYQSTWDNDGQATKGYLYTRNELTNDLSQEIRLASANKNGFVWQVGAYYFHEAFPLNNYFDLLDSSNVPVNLREYHYHVPSTSYAAFGQISYDITGKLRVTGGTRYSHDDKQRTGYSYVGSLTQNVNSGTAVRAYAIERSHVTSSKVTWLAGLDYKLSPWNLLYGKVETGYKSGGFNNFGLGTYAPETLTDYEVGSKNRFFHDTMQVNLSGFYYDYRDQQVSEYVAALGNTAIVNAGVSHIYGSELETIAKLTANDQLDFSAAYLHARYVSLEVANGSSNLSLNGNETIQSPEWTLTGAYQHTFYALGGTLVPRVQSQYLTSYYLTINNNPDDRQRAFTRTDLSLTYRPANVNLSVQAYVRNIENSVVISDASQSGVYDAVLYQFDPPRTYGVQAQFNW